MMELFLNQQDKVAQLMHAGGSVLWVILLVSVLLWGLIIERLLFFKFSYPQLQGQCLSIWQKRPDKTSITARQIRVSMLSEAHIAMHKTVPIIKILIKICPLLGLLGTVTGMIHVFDVMAVTGNDNPRAMADGVSQATIPTMAGMVVAIAGLYFSKLIEEKVSDASHHLADLLRNH